MNIPISKQQQNLAYAWLSNRILDTMACHGVVHTGPMHCFQHFLLKLLHVAKVSSKYYIFFHLIPLFLRLKKAKRLKNVPKIVASSGYQYGRSVLFMTFLVGLLRAGLCLQFMPKSLGVFKVYPFFATAGITSAVSILFEDKSRRCQITYYVLAKAIRSAYIYLKRTCNLEWKGEYELLHVLVMSVLYYLFNHQSRLLKFRRFFEIVLGQD